MVKNRFINQLLKLVVLLVIFVLAQALCVGGVWYLSDLKARNTISPRLDIEPSWKSLENYLEAHIQVGMSRAEVLKQADEVGSANINFFFIGEMYCEVYSFSVGPFNSSRGGRWAVCYDQDDHVTQIEQMLRR